MIDLHSHSSASDGAMSPAESAGYAADRKLRVWALTDHDTVAGIPAMKKLLTNKIKFIPGIELTCKARDIKCHILGYNIDEKNSVLVDLIEKGKLKGKAKIKVLSSASEGNLSEEECTWAEKLESLLSRKS